MIKEEKEKVHLFKRKTDSLHLFNSSVLEKSKYYFSL